MNEKMRKISDNQGITLVILVVIIIVLLILAGISIGFVLNSEELFQKANLAATKYNQSKEEELNYLGSRLNEFDKYNGIYDKREEGTPTPTDTVTLTP